MDLLSYKVYGGSHKGGYGIVNCNPRYTYCPLVPKRDNFMLLTVHLWNDFHTIGWPRKASEIIFWGN